MEQVHSELKTTVDRRDPQTSLDDLCHWKGQWKVGTQRDICLSLWGRTCRGEDCTQDNFHNNPVRFENYCRQ